ncbi:MAG: DPP IV N-terminal domain-containing protein, partial [Paludibacteraceae bacterium]|nr:DPP IV N-terminal domain-containing protein [Paludibacteraceae bacterium]
MKIQNRLFIALMLLCAVPVMAADDLLDNILNGTYNPKTLTVGAQDTLLGDTLSRRYQLQKENEQKIFRHSFQADYYVYDTQRQSRKQIGGGPVREVTVSPNGRYVAFVKDQNIYIHKLDFGTEVAVTTTTDPFIFNGLSDWLYEEEFGQTTLMAFSPDSKQLAFIRLDERR